MSEEEYTAVAAPCSEKWGDYDYIRLNCFRMDHMLPQLGKNATCVRSKNRKLTSFFLFFCSISAQHYNQMLRTTVDFPKRILLKINLISLRSDLLNPVIPLNDIQWEDGCIHITRNVTFAKNQPCIGTPKTQKGCRLIPPSEKLIKFLGEKRTDDTFIIGEEQAIFHQSFKWRMKRIHNTIDLHGATPHVLRHTYLTYLAATGLDVKTLQAIAGHSYITTTMNRYVHPQKENIMRAGAVVDKMLD